jgi:MFS family permease
MRLPDAFRSLRYRDFRVFFVAQTISQIATWMHSVAQTWLILALTNSPRLLGLITMLHWGPILLLALPSGAIADRVAKRRLLMATQAAQACTALTVTALAATGVVAYWHVGVLALCAGLANTLFNVARQSFVNETVGRDDVVNAVALSSAAFNGDGSWVPPRPASSSPPSAWRRRSFSAARATFSSSPRWPRSAWRVARAASARRPSVRTSRRALRTLCTRPRSARCSGCSS